MRISLGMAIKTTRSELRMSQEKLAERAGLHRTYISDIERGARNPTLGSIEKLARALDISMAGLFERAISHGAEGLVEILLVEDDPDDVEMTMHAFKKARIRNPVHVVRDGEQALDFIFATGPYAHRRNDRRSKVILLDLHLPKIGGIEVLRRIKGDSRTRKIPVIILTVSDQQADIAECRRLGAENYIVKPVKFKDFSEVMPRFQFDWALLKRSKDWHENPDKKSHP